VYTAGVPVFLTHWIPLQVLFSVDARDLLRIGFINKQYQLILILPLATTTNPRPPKPAVGIHPLQAVG
jgi:hypothetical protein